MNVALSIGDPYPYPSRVLTIPDGRAGALRTVAIIRDLIEQAKFDPRILNIAAQCVSIAPAHDGFAEVSAIFEWVRARIRYVMDPVGVESVADPATVIRRGVGDCDDMVTLLGALLESVGYPVNLVIAGYQTRQFEHIYLRSLVNGSWLALDPTENHPPGWEPSDPLILKTEF